MCDELRAHSIGPYGHPTVRTPHLDRLAAGGCRFEHAVSNNPVCMPARTLLLSGQHSRTAGALTNVGWPGLGPRPMSSIGFPQWPTGRRVHFPHPTLPELLQHAGYATAAIGKWHLEAWPDAIGFDHHVIPAHHHANSAQWFTRDGSPVYSPDGFGLDHEMDAADAFVQSHSNSHDPFFLYLNLSPPHMPLLDAPEHYLQMYSDDDVAQRANVPPDYQPDPETVLTYLWDYRHYRDRLPYACRLPEDMSLRRLEALYMGLTTWVDDAVGRLLHTLDATGQADDTLVVFTSDHGDYLGSHGLMGKGGFHEESIRVPLLLQGPGIQGGQVEDRHVAGLLDLAPTLLDLVDITPPEHFHGQSLAPLLHDPDATLPRDHAFIEGHGGGVAIRTPTATLSIPWAEFERSDPYGPRDLADRATRLWDNAEDPYQSVNLADHSETPSWAEPLETALRDWHARTPWFTRPPACRLQSA